MRRNSLVLETRNIADVKSFDGSAHVHNRAQRRKLAASVKRFGQVKPILVDTSGTVIDGHALLETLIELAKTEVVVLVVQDLNDDEIRALRLALNRIPEDATWNPAKLRTEVEHLISINFDMTVTGFDQTEKDRRELVNRLFVTATEILEDSHTVPSLHSNMWETCAARYAQIAANF